MGLEPLDGGAIASASAAPIGGVSSGFKRADQWEQTQFSRASSLVYFRTSRLTACLASCGSYDGTYMAKKTRLDWSHGGLGVS